MWIENGLLRRPPPKPDRRFSRIRLSSSWLPMDWLRHSTPGFGGVVPAAQACAPLTCFAGGPLSGRHRASKPGFPSASGRSALRHYPDPCGMELQRLPTPRPCPPWLHGRYPLLRYYEGSDPDRPFRHRPWFPDSRHSNFRPFHLQPSAVLHQTRSTPSTLAALFCSGFAFRSQARQNRRPNRVHLSGDPDLVTDWSFTSSCSPPGVIAPAQLLSVTGPTVSARSGTFTLLFKCALRRTERGVYAASTLFRPKNSN